MIPASLRRDLARLRMELFGPGQITTDDAMRAALNVLATAALISNGLVLIAVMAPAP